MPALKANLVVEQGSRYRLVIDVTVDWLPSLAGYDARGSVWTSQTLPGRLMLADWTNYMTVDAGNGQVVIDIPADVTAEYDWVAGHYDLELFDGTPANDVRFAQGQVRVDPEVTVS